MFCHIQEIRFSFLLLENGWSSGIKSKLWPISNFHSSILKQFVCTLKKTLKISVCMWRQPSVSKRTLSNKEKATGVSASLVITVCCNSAILSCQNFGPKITSFMFSSRLFYVQLLLFWIIFINSYSWTAFLLTFRGNILCQIFICSSKTVLYCALLPPLLQECWFSWKELTSLLINTFLCTSACFLSPSFSHIVQKS